MLGGLIGIILVLACIGFILWMVINYIPMPQIFRTVILVVACIVLILWLLNVFGLLGGGIGTLGGGTIR